MGDRQPQPAPRHVSLDLLIGFRTAGQQRRCLVAGISELLDGRAQIGGQGLHVRWVQRAATDHPRAVAELANHCREHGNSSFRGWWPAPGPPPVFRDGQPLVKTAAVSMLIA